MSRSKTRQGPQPSAEQEKRDDDDYARRLRAVGIVRESAGPADMDAFRYELARRICMFINDWHGCPERVCRRQRGCMAPKGNCTNAKKLPPDPDGRRWAETRLAIRRALDERLAECGLEDE